MCLLMRPSPAWIDRAIRQPGEVRAQALISVTAEMRQFELIIAEFQPEAGQVAARIFHGREELPFAGTRSSARRRPLHERYAAPEPDDHGSS